MIAVLLSPGYLALFLANQVVLSQRFNFLYTQFVSSLSLFFFLSAMMEKPSSSFPFCILARFNNLFSKLTGWSLAEPSFFKWAWLLEQGRFKVTDFMFNAKYLCFGSSSDWAESGKFWLTGCKDHMYTITLQSSYLLQQKLQLSKRDLLNKVCHKNGYSSSVLKKNHFQKVSLAPGSHWLTEIQMFSHSSYNILQLCCF